MYDDNCQCIRLKNVTFILHYLLLTFSFIFSCCFCHTMYFNNGAANAAQKKTKIATSSNNTKEKILIGHTVQWNKTKGQAKNFRQATCTTNAKQIRN